MAAVTVRDPEVQLFSFAIGPVGEDRDGADMIDLLRFQISLSVSVRHSRKACQADRFVGPI